MTSAGHTPLSRRPLVRQVERAVKRHGLFGHGDLVVVGVSGGADSVFLALALHALAPHLQIALHVAHLNHGWRGEEAAADAAFVARLAGRLGVPATLQTVDAPAYAAAERLSPEEAARRLRYAFFRDVCTGTGARVVAAGHTQDDAVETALIAWLRGSGPAGIGNMDWSGPLPAGSAESDASAGPALSAGFVVPTGPAGSPRGTAADRRMVLVRPLLELRRDAVRAALRAWGEPWREDSTNENPAYLRTRVRRELLPLLESVAPGFRAPMLRSIELMRAAADYQRRAAAATADRLFTVDGEALVARRSAFLAADPALHGELLRCGVAQLQGTAYDVEWQHISSALDVIRRGRGGAAARLSPRVTLRLRAGSVVLAPSQPAQPQTHPQRRPDGNSAP